MAGGSLCLQTKNERSTGRFYSSPGRYFTGLPSKLYCLRSSSMVTKHIEGRTSDGVPVTSLWSLNYSFKEDNIEAVLKLYGTMEDRRDQVIEAVLEGVILGQVSTYNASQSHIPSSY